MARLVGFGLLIGVRINIHRTHANYERNMRWNIILILHFCAPKLELLVVFSFYIFDLLTKIVERHQIATGPGTPSGSFQFVFSTKCSPYSCHVGLNSCSSNYNQTERAQHTNNQLTNLDGDREKSLINFSILFLNDCKRVFHCSNSQLHNIVSGERAAALARWHILYDSQIDLPVNFVCEAPCASYARRPVIVWILPDNVMLCTVCVCMRAWMSLNG